VLLRSLYGLEAPRTVDVQGAPIASAWDLGRFTQNYTASRARLPHVVTTGRLDSLEAQGLWHPLTAVPFQVTLLSVPNSGLVLMLDTTLDDAPTPETTGQMLSELCFSRSHLGLAGQSLIPALTSQNATWPRGVDFGLDVHQQVFLSKEEASTWGLDFHGEPDSTGGSVPTFAGDDDLLYVVYRGLMRVRRGHHNARFPREWNKTTGSRLVHARGVLVGVDIDSSHQLIAAATGAQMVAALAELRRIRLEAQRVLGRLSDAALTSSVSARRAHVERLVREADSLEIAMAFGVEAHVDSLLLPEIVVEDLQRSLSETFGIASGIASARSMLRAVDQTLDRSGRLLASVEAESLAIGQARGNAYLFVFTALTTPAAVLIALLAIDPGDRRKLLGPEGNLAWYLVFFLSIAIIAISVEINTRRRRRRMSPMSDQPTGSFSIPMHSISAHRGGKEHSSADILAAYRDIIERGVDFVEFDVRRTADDILVVAHDEAHDGMQIKASQYDDLNKRLPVPRLDELLPLLAGRVRAHVDLKEIGYEAEVVNLVEGHLGSAHAVYTTLEDESVKTIRELYPELPALLSLGRDGKGLGRPSLFRLRASEYFPFRRLYACGATGVAAHHRLATPLLRFWLRRRDFLLMVWTVDREPDIVHWLRRPDVHVVVTNKPSAAMALRSAEMGVG